MAVVCFALTLCSAAPASPTSRVNAARSAVAWGSRDVDTDEAFASCGARLQNTETIPFRTVRVRYD